MDGLLIFNKPSGITSNNTLQKIKKILKIKKAGYVGTLDPVASGILLICLGKSTKLFNFLIKKKKTYLVSSELGKTTNTFDSYGYINKTYNKPKNLNKKKIKKILSTFIGNKIQISPQYSALKHKGIPLYKYAIKGISIKKKKKIYIHNIKLLKFKLNILKLKITCSKGTYIRRLIHEIGKKLKYGAYIIKLIRIKIGKYSIKKSYNFIDLLKKKKKKIQIIKHKNIKKF